MAEEQPSLFSRICCCSSGSSKEPPVELIRSNSIPRPQMEVASKTVGGTNDVLAESPPPPSTVTSGSAEEKGENVTKKDSFEVNDIMMDDIVADEDDAPMENEVVEDEVSIRTGVVEAVDEKDLEDIEARTSTSPHGSQPSTGIPHGSQPSTGKPHDNEEEPEKIHEKGYISPRTAEEASKGEYEEEDDDEVEQEELVEHHGHGEVRKVHVPAMEKIEIPPDLNKDGEADDVSEILSTSRSTADVVAVLTRKEEDDDSDDEILIEEVDVPLPTPPPPPPPALSMMYGDLTSDDESDGDDVDSPDPPIRGHSVDSSDEGEVVEVEDDEDDKEDHKDKDGGVVEETDDDLINLQSGRDEKENEGITRLSVKSDGRATLTSGSLRVALDVREMTDDEFSEKLI